MNEKITFPELVELVATAANTSKRMSEVFLKEFFATVSTALISGNSVKIKGLGTFKVTTTKERSTRNINNGEIINIPEHKKISFVPDEAMAHAINLPFDHFTAVTLDDRVTDSQLQEVDNMDLAPEAVQDETPQPEVPQVQQPEQEPEPETPAQDEPEVITPPPFVHVPAPEPATPPAAPVVAVPPVAPPPAPSVMPEPQPEPVIEQEPEAVTEDTEGNPRSWWRGFITGAAAMLALGIITFTITHCNTGSTAVSTDTTMVAADTTAAQPADKEVKAQAQPVVTDTVTSSKDKWPVNIAKRHYGDGVFWVYIYLENQDKIEDFNNVPAGTVLVIPPAEKYGIDAADPASRKRAQEESIRVFTAKK